MDEFEFIDWIRKQTELDAKLVPIGPGDDCAVVNFNEGSLLVTTDQCADGVHFILSQCGPEVAGYKVMARNLSDIAAMAGTPLAAVATVMLPKGMAERDAQEIYRGMRRAGDRFDCPVVGGDVGSWDGKLMLTVTMFGKPAAGKPITRGGAQVGDAICVTGTLGGSLPGGKHLTFVPRIAEAAELAKRFDLHAMIDISDGFAQDLGHICRQSGVGAEIIADEVPLSAAARQASNPLTAALYDGEDYELLFTLSQKNAATLLAVKPTTATISRVGRITADKQMQLLRGGRAERLEPKGYRHRV